MNDMCTIQFTGNLTRDPEVRDAKEHRITGLRVAFTSSKRDGDEWKPHANYIDVTLFGNPALRARKLKKGNRVGIEGRLEQERWLKDGQNHEKFVCKANYIYNLEMSKPLVEETQVEQEYVENPF